MLAAKLRVTSALPLPAATDGVTPVPGAIVQSVLDVMFQVTEVTSALTVFVAGVAERTGAAVVTVRSAVFQTLSSSVVLYFVTVPSAVKMSPVLTGMATFV